MPERGPRKLKSGAMIGYITKDQLCLFDMITACIEKNGRPPFLREIQFYFGLGSVDRVRPMLEALVKRGLITRNETRRGIKAKKIQNEAKETEPTA